MCLSRQELQLEECLHNLAIDPDDLRARSSPAANEDNSPLLPAELLDHIFEYLHPEDWEATRPPSCLDPPWRNRDLLACSLVSRAWHAHARRRLFRDVVFVVRVPPTRSFADFCAFVHATPEVRASVRRLRIEGRDRHICAGRIKQWVELEQLRQLLGGLPRLEVLHLCNFFCGAEPLNNPQEPRTPIRLRRLHISYTEFDNIPSVAADAEFIALLQLFSQIEELHLTGRGLKWILEEETVDQLPVPKARLEVTSLILERQSCTQALMDFFKGSFCLESLKSLVMHVLEAPSPGDRALFNSIPDVAHLTRSINTLRIYVKDHTRVLFPAMARKVESIAVRSSNHLHELTIGFNLPFSTHTDLIDPAVIRYVQTRCLLDHLSRRAFPALRDVVFELTFHPGNSDARAWVRNDAQGRIEQGLGAGRLTNELDMLLCQVIERCELPGITFECAMKGRSEEVDFDYILAKMFPRLAENKRILRRNVRSGIWQKYERMW